LSLRENEGAENMPDPLVFREIYVRPVNGYERPDRPCLSTFCEHHRKQSTSDAVIAGQHGDELACRCKVFIVNWLKILNWCLDRAFLENFEKATQTGWDFFADFREID